MFPYWRQQPQLGLAGSGVRSGGSMAEAYARTGTGASSWSARALGRAPSEQRAGPLRHRVTVITTRAAAGQLEGLTVNSFSAVSLDPPLVLWSLKARLPPACRASRAQAISPSTCWEPGNSPCPSISPGAAGQFQAGARAWARWLPAAARHSCHLRCRKQAKVVGGDHVVFFGRIERAVYREGEPLVSAPANTARTRRWNDARRGQLAHPARSQRRRRCRLPAGEAESSRRTRPTARDAALCRVRSSGCGSGSCSCPWCSH